MYCSDMKLELSNPSNWLITLSTAVWSTGHPSLKLRALLGLSQSRDSEATGKMLRRRRKVRERIISTAKRQWCWWWTIMAVIDVGESKNKNWIQFFDNGWSEKIIDKSQMIQFSPSSYSYRWLVSQKLQKYYGWGIIGGERSTMN